MSRKYYVALSPWLVFAVVARGSGQGATVAAVLALATTLAVVWWPSASQSLTLLNAGAIALFSGLAGLGLVLGPDGIDQFGRVYAVGGLALIALGSLALRPILEPYTVELVPPAHTSDERFDRANRTITSIWAAAFAAMTASFLVSALLRSPVAATVFNWLVPGAIALFAISRATARWEDDFDPDEVTSGLDVLADVMGG